MRQNLSLLLFHAQIHLIVKRDTIFVEAPVFWVGALRDGALRNGWDDVVVDHLDDDWRNNLVDEVLLVLGLGRRERNLFMFGFRVLVVHDTRKDHVHVEKHITDWLRRMNCNLGNGRRRSMGAARLRARGHARLCVAAAGTFLHCTRLGEAHDR